MLDILKYLWQISELLILAASIRRDHYGIYIFSPRETAGKNSKKKNRIKLIQSKLQHIPLLPFSGKGKPLYAYCKTNLNFFSKQCTQMNN